MTDIASLRGEWKGLCILCVDAGGNTQIVDELYEGFREVEYIFLNTRC